ncbi:uncharacterized protein LOC119837323 [Zerene cesonia]|uniref:uncharacterized protein LOC119837323 n=1 Tax=Zerene cesonia TaxID=33412 RepID=UPI0018E59EC3|nr:uncharacterized protein LOC119837323 [Zerene cesonia]
MFICERTAKMKVLIIIGFMFVCVIAQDPEKNENVPGMVKPLEDVKDKINEIKDDIQDKSIERPCETLDMNCIRRYLADHSYCKMTYGRVPDPIYRVQATQHLTRVNLTITSTNLTYKGLNGRIEEFYINRVTDQVVLAVEFRNVEFFTKNAFFFFYRRAKEPVITKDFLKIMFNSVVVTSTIPGVHHLRFDRSENFGFSNDITYKFVVGPNAFKHRDPVVLNTFLQIAANLPVNARELLHTEAQYYLTNFVQYSLCDFGLNVI